MGSVGIDCLEGWGDDVGCGGVRVSSVLPFFLAWHETRQVVRTIVMIAGANNLCSMLINDLVTIWKFLYHSSYLASFLLL